MDKSDLLVHVQKLSMLLEDERAKAKGGLEKMRKRVSALCICLHLPLSNWFWVSCWEDMVPKDEV